MESAMINYELKITTTIDKEINRFRELIEKKMDQKLGVVDIYTDRVEEMENILYQTDSKSRSLRFKQIYDTIDKQAEIAKS